MDGTLRRERILSMLKESNEPMTGSSIAKRYNVSRQIIVSDIALLRAQGHEIVSTAEGYRIYSIKEDTFKRVFCVQHPVEEIANELNIIVDNGGHLMDIIVTHEVYGEILVNLHIRTRRQAEAFIQKTKASNFVPLMSLTQGAHYHTVESDQEEVLDAIESELREKGYLLDLQHIEDINE